MTQRDGARPSLWQTTTIPFAAGSMTAPDTAEVVVVGAGITGITLAHLLQQAGKKCVVVEAQAVGYGTTGGTTAHLNTLLDTSYNRIIKDFGVDAASLIARATSEAISLVKSNVQRYNMDCGFEECSGFLFAQTRTQAGQLDEIVEGCGRVGLPVSVEEALGIPVPAIRTLTITGQARLHPLRYTLGLAKEFQTIGGTILENRRVTKVTSKDDRLVVETSHGDLSAHSVVFATHIPIGVNILHLRCPAYRSYAIAVKLEDGAYPSDLYYDMFDPYHYYRSQQIDGDQFLIVGGEDHKTGEEPNTNGSFLQLESHVRSHFHVKEVVSRWSSQFFESVDGLPYIGHLPGNPPNVFVATGFGGNGITYSHVAASLLRDIILEKPNALADLLSPGRIKPIAGFADFVRHNTDVVRQFVSRGIKQEEIQELSALSAGEARVVKFNDESIAIYKDDDGRVHAISPRCTHMQCTVAWNAAEQSWDCPCHGARYSFDGRVLNGPAVHDLHPISLMEGVRDTSES